MKEAFLEISTWVGARVRLKRMGCKPIGIASFGGSNPPLPTKL